MNTNSIINGFLRQLHTIKNTDFVKEYDKVTKINESLARINPSSSIIIAPFTFDNTHAFEALFARKALIEGKKVYSFLCGHGIDYCEKKGHGARLNNIRCRICNQTQREYLKTFGTEGFFIGDRLSSSQKSLINDYMSENTGKKGDYEKFLGVDVNKVLYSALQRYYFEAEPSMENSEVTNGFVSTILNTIIEFDNLCKLAEPEYVIVSHGTYSSWGSIVEYCKVNGIRVIVWGRVYNEYGIYFSENESYLSEMVNGSNEPWLNNELSVKKEKRITSFFKMRTGEQSVDFLYDYNKSQKKQLSAVEIRTLCNIPENSKIVGMFPNIPWDGSVSGVSEAFSSYRDWLYTTIDFFARQKEVYLLIRTHPAELANDAEIGRESLRTLIDEMDIDLPQNIVIIPADSKINSFAIGKASIFGVFYCSTVGMELTYLNVPLVCAGPSPLRNKEIVYDAKDKKHYLELLESGLNRKLSVTDIMKKNLIKFSYYNMFSRVMPETLIEFKGPIFQKLLFNDEAQLLNNPVLNHLYETIERKDAYIFDTFYEKDNSVEMQKK